jgi:hypothetical protein
MVPSPFTDKSLKRAVSGKHAFGLLMEKFAAGGLNIVIFFVIVSDAGESLWLYAIKVT